MARPSVVNGFTVRVKTVCGNMYITINKDDNNNNIQDIFINLGKSGTCGKAFMEMIGRLLTHAIRKNVDITTIVKSIKGIRCKDASEDNVSCANAIAYALETYINEKAIKEIL